MSSKHSHQDHSGNTYHNYELHRFIHREAIQAHRTFNLWHEIDGYLYYAKPANRLLTAENILIKYDLHPIISQDTNLEIQQIYVSPVIRLCCRKFWPAQHKLPAYGINVADIRLSNDVFVVAWTCDIHNYYHLLFDLCPRLLICAELHHIHRELPVIIVGHAHPLVSSIIQLLFPQLSNYVTFLQASVVLAEKAIFPLAPQPSYMDILSIRRMSNLIKLKVANATHSNNADKDLGRPGILYVIRGISKNGRTIDNESDLARALKSLFGAEIIDPSRMDPLEQWSYFSRADVIIAPHGAGLANLLAASSGTTVIELLPKSFQPSTYCFVSAALELEHNRFIYEDQPPIIPIDELLNYLLKFLPSNYKLIGRKLKGI